MNEFTTVKASNKEAARLNAMTEKGAVITLTAKLQMAGWTNASLMPVVANNVDDTVFYADEFDELRVVFGCLDMPVFSIDGINYTECKPAKKLERYW